MAEWAGHSVDVLLRIYAKCVVGQDELAERRISAKRCARTNRESHTLVILDLGTYGHSDLHFAAHGCAQPHTGTT